MFKALVNGGGVAALCCARLLSDKGWEVSLRRGAPPSSPTLVLQPLTVRLIEQIFCPAEDIFRGAHLLERRLVKWGREEPDVVGVPCLVMRGDVLAERLLTALACRVGIVAETASAYESSYDWTVYAGGRGAAAAAGIHKPGQRRFGRRRAIVSAVRLHRDADTGAASMEATPGGWLFLIPTGGRRAVLQAAVPFRPPLPAHTLRSILEGASLVRRLVSEVTGPSLVFDSAPSMLETPVGTRWMAAGSLACAYDPLCGDGTGDAVRGAILAAAVLDAAAHGPEPGRYVEHYRDRLACALHDHLLACHSFYSAGGFDSTWSAELEATADGLRHLSRVLASRPRFRYGLRGLQLTPL